MGCSCSKRTDDVSSKYMGDSSSKAMDDVSSKTMGDSSTKTMEDVSSKTMGDSSTKTMEDVSSKTMGDSSTRDINELHQKDVQEYIDQHGMSGIEEYFKGKLEQWKDVVIKIGVTGDSGVGKSSFINAIRGLKDDDEGAAPTGVTETTREAAVYPHPTNNKIEMWDLPGIGTPNYPDLETYCAKVDLKEYDTFLILTAVRFTKNDLLLAEKVKSVKKSFFFIRTKIDQDVRNERKKKAFNEEALLKNIRKDCLENLKGLEASDEVVFLISNSKTAKWDFARLTQAIIDALPPRQKESLTLSLDLLTSRSKDILKRKVQILRGRIWMIAGASGTGALVPVPGLSVAVDLALLANEVSLYRSQIGLPDENSDEFKRMTPGIQKKVRKFCWTNAEQISNHLAAYGTRSAVEEFARYIPFVGPVIAGSISFTATYYFLHGCLNDMEETALEFLDETNTKVADDLDID